MSTPRGDPDGPATQPGPGLWGGLWQRLVRSPTVRAPGDALEEAAPSSTGAYSREALQSMIERKRHNDAARQREFDMLRALRRRGARADASGSASPPLFHSSIPSSPDERATTLKKIDEIEAQMSIQWRRVKARVPVRPPAPGPAPAREAAAASGDSTLAPSTLLRGARARPAGLTLGPLASTVLGPVSVAADVAPWTPADPSPPGLAPGLFDPEVEQAALCFASGDVAGTQAVLQALLDPAHPRSESPETWELLFDLYRATGQQAAYEEHATDYACRFQRSPPQWRCLFDAPSAPAGAPQPPVAPGRAGEQALPAFDWTCPPVLDAQAVRGLQETLSQRPAPWHLSWIALERVQPEALPGLAQLVARWTREPVRIRVAGIASLERHLDSRTACGDRQADPLWWTLRMDWLRAMRRSDEFELVALDYCVTYEVSAPAWEPPRCEVRALHPQAEPSADAVFDLLESRVSALGTSELAALSSLGSSTFLLPPVGELCGTLLGDLTGELARLDATLQGADPLVISCARLVRIDFEAAGALLNWVAAREAEGRSVHLVDVHRLVAAFFAAMGLAAQARITLRRD